MGTQETSDTAEPTRAPVQLQADLPQCSSRQIRLIMQLSLLKLVTLNCCTPGSPPAQAAWKKLQSAPRQRSFSWLHQLYSSQPVFLLFPQACEQVRAQLMATICRLREEIPNSSNLGADKPAP